MKRETAEKARELLNEIERHERVVGRQGYVFDMTESEKSEHYNILGHLACALAELDKLKDE